MDKKLSRVERSADRLEAILQKAATQALEDLIPPWCVGVSPDFWKTDEGRLLANTLWLINYKEAVSLRQAMFIVFPFLKAIPIEEQRERGMFKLRSRVIAKLFHYPLPDPFMAPNLVKRRSSYADPRGPYYMLRSEAEDMHVREQIRHEAIEENYRKKAEREAHLGATDSATPDEPEPQP